MPNLEESSLQNSRTAENKFAFSGVQGIQRKIFDIFTAHHLILRISLISGGCAMLPCRIEKTL